MSYQFGNGDIGVAIVGDVGDLQRKLGQGETAVDSFGRRVKSQFRGVADEAGRLEGGVTRLGAGLKGALIGGSLAVGLIKLKNVTMDAVASLAQAQVQVDRLQNGFSFGAGGLANGAKELAFVRSEVNRLGLELGGTASQYMKMVAASRGNKMAGEQTRELFRSIAEASVVMGMGVDQSERSFMAVTQMMSKGKVMAEELRGQLGEHLPGAFSIAARAMNMTEAELNKLMETGGLMAEDFLPRFAAQLRGELAGSIERSTLSMQANLNRLSTSWTNFKQQTAQGGIGGAISGEVKGIASELTVLGESMEASRLRGDGMWMSIANVSGAAVGRSSIGAVELVFESFNGVVNALTGDLMHLNTNIDLMPDFLKPAAQAMELTTQKIAQAEREYQALAARLAQAPDNIYVKSELNQLRLYIIRLREAQKEQRALMGISVGDPGSVGSVGSGDAALARAERADYDRRKALLDKFNYDHRSASEKFRDEVAKQKAALGDLYSPAIEAKIRESLIKPTKGAGQAAKAAKDEFSALMNQITAKDSGLAPDFYKDLNTLHAGYQKGRVSVDEYRNAVGLLVSQQQFAKDAASEMEKAQKELGETMAAASALADKDEQRYADAASALVQSNADLRDEIQLIGLNDKQRALLVRTKEAEIIAEKELFLVGQQNAGASAATLASLEREIALRRARVGLMGNRDAAVELAEAMEKQADEAKRFWDSVDNTAHDVFIRVATEGSNAFEAIGKTLKAAVLDMLYQMTIKKWIFQISGQVGGLGGGGGGGLNSWVDVAQQAYSYFGGGASAGAGAGAASYGGTYAASGVSSASMVSVPSTGVASTGTASSTMSAGGYTGYGYMGYAALIAAAVMVAKNLYEKGYTRAALGYGDKTQYEFGTGNTTSAGRNEGNSLIYTMGIENANRQLGDALGLSEKWVDILSGSVRMAALFGRKLSGYGFEASIAGGQATTVQGYEKYKGGVFRSDKTTNFDINPADAAALKAQIEGVTEGTRNMARAMGYSEEAINSYSGTLKVNFKGAKTAAEQAERYSDALSDLQFEMLKTASGTKLTKDDFASMMEEISASVQAAGISAQGIGDILAQGAIGRLTESQVGEQLSEVIIGGIYNTIAQNAMAPVAELFMSSIITPIFTAIMAGVPISQAVSQAAIQNVVATAQNAAAALNAILADPGFQSAISQIQGAIGSVSKISVSSAKHVKAYGSAVSAAAQAAQAAAQEKYGLETRLLTLLNNTTKLRERELNALSAGNRPLQQRIWALEDATSAVDSALEALRNASDAERDRLNDLLDTARDVESSLNDIFGSLRDNIRELRGEVQSTSTMQAAQAVALIRQAAASGILPSADMLSDAVASARAGVENTQYGSRIDRDRAYLTLANDMAALKNTAQPQLSAAEQTVLLLEAQIDALDLQLKTAEDSVNALYGIDASVMTVADAVNNLSINMAAYATAVAAAASISVSTSAPVTSAPRPSGSYSAPAPAKVWTAAGYWAKNPDLQAHFASQNLANAPMFNQNPALSARDEYLAWHWATRGQAEKRRFAKGGAFTNGIVTRPTDFNIGQMGEGGFPEAVMPLTNVGGRLGVHASGGNDAETKALLRELIAAVKRVETVGTQDAISSEKLYRLMQFLTKGGRAMQVAIADPEFKALLASMDGHLEALEAAA